MFLHVDEVELKWEAKGTYWELLIELVGQQRVRELTEVQFAEGAHAVDVLDVNILCQVRDLLGVKLVAGNENRKMGKGGWKEGMKRKTSANYSQEKWVAPDQQENMSP